jgi:serine/threonine protein kinase
MTTTANPAEVDHLRDRVRLYLQVLLIIDVGSRISDALSPFFIQDLVYPDWPLSARVLRWAVTVAVAAGWSFARFAKPNRLTLIALESGVTLGLVPVYINLALIHTSGPTAAFGPMFAMFGITMLLSLRAALVPSPVSRTVVIGILSVVGLFVIGRESIDALDPVLIDGLSFIGGAFVLTTSITSFVIYGLRRQVRHALQLGQYTLEEKLGEGGMGSVYRARHAMLRRQAAIKLIKPELSGEGSHRDRALQRFEREAQATADLKSAHTIELYDFGVSAEGEFYYVMELLDGINLEVVVEKYGPMPPDRVVFLLRQMCDSLEEAHAAGLIHRDIKPANIFLCRHGLRHDFVKVLDFGIVALGPEPEQVDQKLTAEGVAGGTPAYMAPEMALSAEAVDGRADVYAMGCVAYWLLSGHTPFERETALATILAHVKDTPTPPSQVSEIPIPEQLDALVLECLEKEPANRPASAAELSRRLAETVTAEGWDQEKAARWWELHKPAREEVQPSLSRQATVKVTRALP